MKENELRLMMELSEAKEEIKESRKQKDEITKSSTRDLGYLRRKLRGEEKESGRLLGMVTHISKTSSKLGSLCGTDAEVYKRKISQLTMENLGVKLRMNGLRGELETARKQASDANQRVVLEKMKREKKLKDMKMKVAAVVMKSEEFEKELDRVGSEKLIQDSEVTRLQTVVDELRRMNNTSLEKIAQDELMISQLRAKILSTQADRI